MLKTPLSFARGRRGHVGDDRRLVACSSRKHSTTPNFPRQADQNCSRLNAMKIQRGSIYITLLITLMLGCSALLPKLQAVVPAPDGGYPGGNTAEGFDALLSQTSGLYNTAIGAFSNLSLTTGSLNTGVGAGTLLTNTADSNTATGAGALFSNTTGADNTANGAFALFSNTSGSNITAIGSHALLSNTADENTAVGSGALAANTTGGANTAIGYAALAQGNGGANTAIGDLAGFNITGNGNIDIGFHEAGVAGENNTTRIGNIGATAQDTGI